MQLNHSNTMAATNLLIAITLATIFMIPFPAIDAQLTPDFYDSVCPQALPTIKSIVYQALSSEIRMGASLLRLHFHDCFVNGCDGSILLDDTSSFTGEKTALPNNNSVRGFDVIDQIKAAVDQTCNGSVVSCADILAVAARDSVFLLGGKQYWYQVLLGRRDATNASLNDANNNIPPPTSNFSTLLSSFESHGLELKDLVVLSGGHTIGFARCTTFRGRLYNDTNIDSQFSTSLTSSCPTTGSDDTLSPLDSTAGTFDTQYYSDLLNNRGLLHSDQELYKGDGGDSDLLVQQYSTDSDTFATDFAASMINMGNIQPLTGDEGEIRSNCRKVNSN